MSSIYIYCPHCQEEVSDRTFRKHKQFHFSEETNSWKTIRDYENENNSPVKKLRMCPDDNRDGGHGARISQYPDADYVDADVPDKGDPLVDIKMDPISKYVTMKVEEMWDDIAYDDITEDLGCISATAAAAAANSTIEPTGTVADISRWVIIFIGAWSTAYNIPMTAIGYLLLFMNALFSACAMFSSVFSAIAKVVPKSVYALRSAQGLLEDKFEKYVICPKCNMLYHLSDIRQGNGQIPTCTYVPFPDHSQRRFRSPCGEKLMKEVILKGEKRVLYPIKTFCYKSIISSLKCLLDRPGFQQMAESWRSRKRVPGTYRDVYDGRVWREFQSKESGQFFDKPRRYGFTINVDWFQPYKHSPYSVGAIYLSMMNLPRDERYKKENMIIAGIIPGPDEPTKDINGYLEPLVSELVTLWEEGIEYRAADDKTTERYYGAFLCCACDIPAARKVCGFLGHAAKSGCSKCKKKFKSGKFGEKIDYGGFDREEPRTDSEHRRVAEETRRQTTSTKRQAMESEFGVRYTTLMKLPYYDCISSTIIDPMHNLFLGTAKYMFKTVWFEKLDKNCLEKIQESIDNMVVPTTLGRIPRKIASSFSSFTADQWKNWTLYFSPVALKNVLPKKDYDCWMLFVSACRTLSSVTLSTRQLQEGHGLYMTFCRTFQQLYGSMCVTPNMHLHSHLIQCILDFGPMHAFWLYSFERMNGALGSFHTNKRSVEMQMMRHISNTQSILTFEKPILLAGTFASSFAFENTNREAKLQTADDAQTLLQLSESRVSVSSNWCTSINIEFIGVRHDVFMQEYYLNSLRSSVSTIVDVDPDSVTGSAFKYPNIVMCGETYGSSESRLSRSSVILASWCGVDGAINIDSGDVRPGIVRFFLTFFVPTNDGKKRLTLAFVNWFQKVHCRHALCTGVEVWCHKLYEPDGPASFMPVQRIKSKCVCATVRIKNEELLAVTPHIRQLYC